MIDTLLLIAILALIVSMMIQSRQNHAFIMQQMDLEKEVYNLREQVKSVTRAVLQMGIEGRGKEEPRNE